MAERVGLSTAGTRGKRVLPVQVGARRRPQGEEQYRADERGHDRVPHPQPAGRARQARVLRCGALREELGKRLKSRRSRIMQQRPILLKLPFSFITNLYSIKFSIIEFPGHSAGIDVNTLLNLAASRFEFAT